MLKQIFNYLNTTLVFSKLINISLCIENKLLRLRNINIKYAASCPGFLAINHLPCNTESSRQLAREARDLEESSRILHIMASIFKRELYPQHDELRQALVLSANTFHKQALLLDAEARASVDLQRQIFFPPRSPAKSFSHHSSD